MLLAGASDQYNGVVDITKQMADQLAMESKVSGTINSLLQARGINYGSAFHSHGGYEDDQMESDVYADLGDDPIEQLEAELAKNVEEARQNGMSEGGCTALAALLKEYQNIFCICLGKSPPAKVPRMIINLDASKRPVKGKTRRYSPDQSKFLDNYT